MTSLRIPAAALGLSTIVALLPAQGALALEAEAFGERLKALATSQGAELEWTGISVDGDEVTLEGVTLGAPGEEDRAPIGEVVLEGVTEEDGGYRVGSFSIPSYSYAEDGTAVEFQGLTVTGIRIPAEGETGPLAGVLMYETAEMPGVSVSAEGKEIMSISGVYAEITPPAGDGQVSLALSVEEFTADLSAADDPEARETVAALGYSTITGNMEMASSWSPSNGRAALEQMQISVQEAGTFSLGVELGGVTPDLVATVQELQAKMETATEEQKAAQGLAMLGLMQQLTFHGATIRFDDDSLTQKVLDYAAAEQGMEAADIANLASAVLPLYLAQLNDPEFSKSVTEAVSAFLQDPQSLVISADPGEPVPFALLFASAMSSPQALVGQLAVTVTANQAE